MLIINYLNDEQTRQYMRAKHLIGKLTPREEQVIKLAVHMLEDEQIAARLGISVYTVRNHIASITETAQSVSGQMMKFRIHVVPYVACFYFVHSRP